MSRFLSNVGKVCCADELVSCSLRRPLMSELYGTWPLVVDPSHCMLSASVATGHACVVPVAVLMHVSTFTVSPIKSKCCAPYTCIQFNCETVPLYP